MGEIDSHHRLMMNAAIDIKKQCAWPEVKREFISHVKTDCPENVKAIPDLQKALDSLDTTPLEGF